MARLTWVRTVAGLMYSFRAISAWCGLSSAAGAQIWTVNHAPHLNSASPIGASGPMLSPWTGFVVFCGYAAIVLAAGLLMFRKRDA